MIFAIAGVYVTQSLVSALSISPYPRWCALLAVRWRLPVRHPVYAALGAEVYLGAVDRALRLPPGSQERRSRMLILRGQVR